MSQYTRHTESKTCEVPLFLSTSRTRLEATREEAQRDRNTPRSRSSTHSLIDANDRPLSPMEPLRPAVYRPPYLSQETTDREHSDLYGAGPAPPQHARVMPSNSDLESGISSQSKPSAKSRTARPRKRITRSQLLRSHIRTKRRLAISFAITIVIASIIYLSLAVTHTSGGAAFHVLSIILLLSLTGVFAHSLIRWVMLKRDYDAHAERRTKHTQPPSFRGWDISWPQPLDNHPPPEPIPVYMSDDHETLSVLSDHHYQEEQIQNAPVQPPPPIYGNFRDSVRINPSHVSVQAMPVSPSIHTPSYAAAISQPLNPNPAHMRGGLGYRPPSYGSEGGITQVLERRRRDVEGKLKGFNHAGSSSGKGRGKRAVKGKPGERAMWVREKKGSGRR